MQKDTTKNRKGSQKHWAKWEIRTQTRETAEIIGKGLTALGHKASMEGIFDAPAHWIVRTDAPLNELQALGLVR